MLSRLMHRFHDVLHRYEAVKEDLKECFAKTKEAFGQVPEFQEFSGALREDFSCALQCWSYKLDIDFEAYNPLNFFHALRVQAKEGGEIGPFKSLDRGNSCFLPSLSRTLTQGFQERLHFCIEEPERIFTLLHRLGWPNVLRVCLRTVLSVYS